MAAINYNSKLNRAFFSRAIFHGVVFQIHCIGPNCFFFGTKQLPFIMNEHDNDNNVKTVEKPRTARVQYA